MYICIYIYVCIIYCGTGNGRSRTRLELRVQTSLWRRKATVGRLGVQVEHLLVRTTSLVWCTASPWPTSASTCGRCATATRRDRVMVLGEDSRATEPPTVTTVEAGTRRLMQPTRPHRPKWRKSENDVKRIMEVMGVMYHGCVIGCYVLRRRRESGGSRRTRPPFNNNTLHGAPRLSVVTHGRKVWQ